MSRSPLAVLGVMGFLSVLGAGVILIGLVIGTNSSASMTDTFSTYVEAINEGRYDEALELVDGDCLDYLANESRPPEDKLQYEVLMAAEDSDAGMMALDDSQFGLTWQLMTKVDGDWKVACEEPWTGG